VKNIFTTIIGGKYRGKKIALPSNNSTRSTKSIVKESYFNTVQFEIVDMPFFEVFAGSGSIGLEAVSRGASKAYFIEIDFKAYKVLNANCEAIDASACITYKGDSFNIYPDVIKKFSHDNSRAFIYLDPPFDIRENMNDIYDKTIKLIENTPKEVVELIAIEHISDKSFPEVLGEFRLKKVKKFGKTTLSYYE